MSCHFRASYSYIGVFHKQTLYIENICFVCENTFTEHSLKQHGCKISSVDASNLSVCQLVDLFRSGDLGKEFEVLHVKFTRYYGGENQPHPVRNEV